MNFLSTALSLVLSFTLQDPRSCFVAGQTSGDLTEPDDKPELSALGLFHKVQKGSEVTQLRVGAAAEKKKKKKKKKGGKKGRSPDSLALGRAGIAGNTYSAVLLFGANEGCIIGVFTYDETGSIVAGEGTGNLPNPPPSIPKTFPLGIDGTVDELDAQGTGLQTINLDFFVAIPEVVPMSLEVTGVVGSKVETMRGAFQITHPVVAGALVDASMTRRRADGYTDQSLRGLYAITCNSGLFTGFASGKLTSDGRGSLSGAMTFNEQDLENPIELRRIITADVTGSYEVEDNGFATVLLSVQPRPFSFIVTTNKGSIITSMAGAVSVQAPAMAPANGALITCELDSLGGFFSEDDYETTMQ